MSDDVRISEWSLRASAGMTTRLQFTSPVALTSFSLFTGGTVDDVDDLTDADEFAATLSGADLVATVDLVVDAEAGVTPLRAVVNGAVQSVGVLRRSTQGIEVPDNTITLNAGQVDYELTILGVIVEEGGGGGGGAVDVVSNVATSRILGRVTAGSGDSEELTATQVRTLLNVEDGATGDMSAAEILTAVKTVDGAGSGLDADLLDGLSSAGFATAAQGTAADAAKTKTDLLTVTQAVDLDALETKVDGIEAGADVTDATNVNAAGAVMESDYDANTILAATVDNTPVPLTLGASTILARLAAGGIVAATPAQLRTLLNVEDGATADQSAAEILAALLTVDGPGSGLDADTLDGIDSGSFVRDTGDETIAGVKTFSSTPVAPAYSASGLTGAVAGARFVGATASGAPSTGTFAIGDYVVDRSGQMWICTVAGSPGTWVAPGSGRELGYASITSSPAGVTVLGLANRIDVTGLSIDFTVGSRPVMVSAGFGQVSNDTADRGAGMAIVDSTTVLQHSIGTSSVSGGIFNMHAEARVAAGAGAKTIKIMVFATIAGTATFSCTATRPGWIRAAEV